MVKTHSPWRVVCDLADSLGASELGTLLGRATGLDLPATLVFDHPSAAAIARFVSSLIHPPSDRVGTLANKTAGAVPAPPAGASLSSPSSPPVVGSLASRTVSAGNPALVDADSVAPAPRHRWDVEAYDCADGPAAEPHARFGGFMAGVELFDAEHFGMRPAEAAVADPQQRLLLVCLAEAAARRVLEGRRWKTSTVP
eukprot:1195079-Prorocentrum_minimum.AAC.3